MGHMSIIHLIFQKIKDNSTQWDRPIPEIKGIARKKKAHPGGLLQGCGSGLCCPPRLPG